MRYQKLGGGCVALWGFWVGLLWLFAGVQVSFAAADFNVTSPGFFFSINGMAPNPKLTLTRGKTYTFSVKTASNHPFQINSPGVVNNNISSGTITYTVPTAATNYKYICSIHFFGGDIITVEPASPPTIQIVSLLVSTNLELKSIGTNNFTIMPEYTTNLASTNWTALTVQTNTFANGTNDTICGRPAGDTVFIRIKAQPN